MPICHGPDDMPEITVAAMKEAMALGLHPIHVICDETGAKVGDQRGMSFIAMVAFVPQVGDRVLLERDRVCDVKRVLYKVGKRLDDKGKVEIITLVPNVYAVLVEDGK